MNKIITSNILDPTIQQPFTGNSLEFLQNATKESILGVILSQIGDSYDSTKAYVLLGLYPYGTNQYKDGYILWNGEIWYSTGKTSTTAFANVAVMNETITNDGTADPVTFTDGVSRNVHNVRRLVLSDAVSGSGDFDLSDAIYINRFKDYTPTFAAYDSGGVLVGGGITAAGTGSYNLSKDVLTIHFAATITTTGTVNNFTITLPVSLSTSPNNQTAKGMAYAILYKSGSASVPCFVDIALVGGGAGSALTVHKEDYTDLGALTSYNLKFSIVINIYR